MASPKCCDVGIAQSWFAGETALDPGFDRIEIAVEHPQQYAECPEILATTAFGFAEAEFFD